MHRAGAGPGRLPDLPVRAGDDLQVDPVLAVPETQGREEPLSEVLNEGMLTHGAGPWLIHGLGTAPAAGAGQAFHGLSGKVCA
jgi:hypothetical protein